MTSALEPRRHALYTCAYYLKVAPTTFAPQGNHLVRHEAI